MAIRYAALSDLQGVYELMCDLEGKNMPWEEFEKIYSQNIDNGSIHYLVAEDDKQLIAFGSIHIQSLLHHTKPVAEIQELVVRDCCRGQGIGAKLIQRLMEISKKQNCELIEVCCNKRRTESHKFYERCGFNKSHYKFTLWWK